MTPMRHGQPLPWLRGFRFLALLLVLVFSLAACAGEDDAAPVEDETTAGTEEEAAPADTELTLATPSTFWVPDAIFDPSADDGLPSAWAEAEPLFRPTFEGPQPLLAASAEQTDETTWTVTLNEGITFQNGKPLDAQAAVDYLNYEREKDPVVGAALGSVTGVEVVDDLTFTITTDQPFPSMLAALADRNATVFDVAAVEEVGEDWNQLVGKGIYTGPFQTTEFKPGREVILERYENYHQGTPELERLRWIRVPDEQAAVKAVQAGEADMVLPASAALKPSVEGTPGVHYVTSGQAPLIFAATFNLNRPPLDDEAVRRAVTLAIDVETMTQGALFDVYPALHGLYPADDSAAVVWQEFDPDEAARVLDEAGWTQQGDTRSKDGEKLELTLITYTEDQESMAVVTQEMLKSVGIESKVVSGDFDAYLNNVKSNKWDVGFYQGFENYGLNAGRAVALTRHFLPDESRVYNPANITDEQIQSIADEILATTDESAVTAGLEEIQQINQEKVYWMGIAQRVLGAVVNDTWQSFEPDPFFLFFDHTTKP